jgi:hypothetical protein
MLSYSRTPAFSNKTPGELQKLIFPSCHADACNIEQTFKHIISTAHKGTTYARYLWQADLEQSPQYQIAYVQLITENDKEYVLGAAIYHKWIADRIILPHRVNTILNRIKKEGLEKILPLLNDEIDPELFFFIISLKYPNRYIAHGKNKWLINKTPEEEQALYPPCADTLCNIRNIVNSLVAIARSGKGFHAYLFRPKPDKEPILKVVYVKKFIYNKHDYLIGTGYTPFIPVEKINGLKTFVDHSLESIKIIGLDNTISEVKGMNSPERATFITQADPPYRYLAHADPKLNNLTTAEIQERFSSFKKFPINVTDLVKKISAIASNGGGFHTLEYPVNLEEPKPGIATEIAYTMPFEYNKQKYFISTSMHIEPTETSLKQMVSAP